MDNENKEDLENRYGPNASNNNCDFAQKNQNCFNSLLNFEQIEKKQVKDDQTNTENIIKEQKEEIDNLVVTALVESKQMTMVWVAVILFCFIAIGVFASIYLLNNTFFDIHNSGAQNKIVTEIQAVSNMTNNLNSEYPESKQLNRMFEGIQRQLDKEEIVTPTPSEDNNPKGLNQKAVHQNNDVNNGIDNWITEIHQECKMKLGIEEFSERNSYNDFLAKFGKPTEVEESLIAPGEIRAVWDKANGSIILDIKDGTVSRIRQFCN